MKGVEIDMYYTINKFSKLVGVTAQTLRNWEEKGTLIPHHKSPSGYRYYSTEQLNLILNKKIPERTKLTIGYCRVSSSKQQDDLERQIEVVKTYLTAQGKPFEIITDIGSGINYNKHGLLEVLRKINNEDTDKIVVLYKDRLVRFGFELIKQIADLHNVSIEVIDSTPKLPQQKNWVIPND